MPECIEVEKLRRELAQHWQGRKIESVSAYGTLVPTNTVDWPGFTKKVEGREITGTRRKGKNIWLNLSDGMAWHIHLWSTGWFLPEAIPEGIHKSFLHKVDSGGPKVMIRLSDGQIWNYYDPRTWGLWEITGVPEETSTWKALGSDWLDNPKEAANTLFQYKGNQAAKNVLRDQTKTAGVGSYMMCEALWEAKINPFRPWRSLSQEEKLRIAAGVEETIKLGMSAKDRDHWNVFDKKGSPCKRCGTKLAYLKESVGGASGLYMCEICQK